MNNPSQATALADSSRLRVLHDLGLLDSPLEPAFERLTQLAARLLNAPVSLITLVHAERHVFISTTGLPEPWCTVRQTPLSHSFCQHVVTDDAPFIVCDARLHPRLSDSQAIPELGIIAYAGVPLRTPDGLVLGALCAIDHQPRDWTAGNLALLHELAVGVMTEIRLCQALRAQQQDRQQQQHAEVGLVAALDHTPDLVWSVGRSYQLVACNLAYTKLFRRLHHHTHKKGMELAEHLDLIKQAAWQMRYDRALCGEAFTADVRLDIPGDPTPTWYELSFAPIGIGADIQGVTVVGRDITSRRGEADALRRLATEHALLYANERSARLEAEQRDNNDGFASGKHLDTGSTPGHPAANPGYPAVQHPGHRREPEVRTVTARMLERLGYQASIASDGAAGIALIATDPEIAAVLLDLTMPGLSGEETLRKLRELRTDIPVVVVSGYSAHEVRDRFASAGIVDVLQKPFTPAALHEVLLRVLGQMGM